MGIRTIVFILLVLAVSVQGQNRDQAARMESLLKRFPEADLNKDGKLTTDEVRAYQEQRRKQRGDQKQQATLTPTHSDVPYGDHERHKLDLWIADSKEPKPLVVCIHGGGFRAGDKSSYRKNRSLIQPLLDAGISVASINYRLTEGGKYPFPAAMHDGGRALQFLRFHSKKYNLDKTRIAATGGSAGACMSMWLAFHEDLADPESNDPIARESTRLAAIAPNAGQSTLDIRTFEEWFGVKGIQEHPALRPLFGIPAGSDEIKITEALSALMVEASPITHLTKDDPPAFLSYSSGDVPVSKDSSHNLWVHHPRLGIKLKEAMDRLGIECHVSYRGGPKITKYDNVTVFLISQLKK